MRNRLVTIFLFALLSLSFMMSGTLSFNYPLHFPEPKYDFTSNPLDEQKILLGRFLFYDPIFSKDNSISCASCHSPYNAFAHSDHDLSHGINNIMGDRNAPSLFNLAWQNKFMWDGAIKQLDMQALAPIEHPGEMGEEFTEVVSKLQKEKFYREQFFLSFGDSTVTGERLLKALSQFQLTLVSDSSKYDLVKMNRATFSSEESKGYDLFLTNCNSCHQEPLFTNYSFQTNGLPIDTTLNDFGKYTISNKSSDSLLFRVPTLRNLKYTMPYMHDGRFRTLDEVFSHYEGVTLRNKNESEESEFSVELSSYEKQNLQAFLLTLNDKKFVFDESNKFPQLLKSQIRSYASKQMKDVKK